MIARDRRKADGQGICGEAARAPYRTSFLPPVSRRNALTTSFRESLPDHRASSCTRRAGAHLRGRASSRQLARVGEMSWRNVERNPLRSRAKRPRLASYRALDVQEDALPPRNLA